MSFDQFLLSADTTDLNYPEIRPTLDLNFARVKALDPRITFTRASGGSYVGADGLIKYAGVNEARFDHDPITGDSLGLLVEEARTNVALDGTTFANPNWLKSGTIINTLFTTSPDGTVTAAKLYPDDSTTNSQHLIVRVISGLPDNTVYTSSIFIKKFGSQFSWCRLSLRSKNGDFTGIYFNYDTKTFGAAIAGPVSFGYQEYPDGWIRLYVTTNTSTGAITPAFHFWIAEINNALAYNYSGGNSDGFYIWGAQLEAGSFPTSYIPTQASTRTRAADNAQITGKNFSSWYRQDEGTVFVKWTVNNPVVGNRGPWCIAKSGVNLRGIGIYYVSANALQLLYRDLSGNTFSTTNFSPHLSNLFQYPQSPSVSASFSNSELFASIYGLPPRVGYSSNINIFNADTFLIGNYIVSGSNRGILNGAIRRITYFPKRLPNAQLQALTR
jgi:hypothetical protein